MLLAVPLAIPSTVAVAISIASMVAVTFGTPLAVGLSLAMARIGVRANGGRGHLLLGWHQKTIDAPPSANAGAARIAIKVLARI
jgi:hypothetical protein